MAMAAIHFLPSSLSHHSHTLTHFKVSTLLPKHRHVCRPTPPNSSADDHTATQTSRRGTKKTSSTAATKKSRARPKKGEAIESVTTKKSRARPKKESESETEEFDSYIERPVNAVEVDDYDDGMDIPFESPPLICCFGAAQKEFVPTVRVSPEQMDPDIYSEWKMLQWNPPEFVRAPGGPPSNVAISHVRLGGRAAFMGKVGDDEFGEEMVLLMNNEKVQTRGVKFDENARTGCSYMKIKFEDGKMKVEKVKDCAENSLLSSELNLAVLKEARIFHFNSEVLTSPTMRSTLFKAISWSKKFGGLIFFDLNLPLPLWKSRDETWEVIKEAWEQADIIEVSRAELEFLLDEDYYEHKRNYKPQYYAEDFQQTRKIRNYYHYTREEVAPLWHDRLKFLFVTDGTLRIHYYSPSFEGVVVGTEDVLITPFTCDRTGSGDAVVAGIMRKLTTQPEMFENQDILERQIRFAIAAGIISQWTIGAVRGFPTESATQNLKEQVYVPSMW